MMSKYKSLIMYVIFGALTTVVNFSAYFLFYSVLNFSNVMSSVLAWFFAVSFAFVTNKIFVFESRSFDCKTLMHEILTFYGCRLTTGILDVVIMYVSVDLLSFNALPSKIMSDIIVNILNYVASLLVVFRK